MGNWILAMAGRLKLMTGINPLTIDQAALTETSDTTYDNPYRQAISLGYSAVFIDSNGNAFNRAKLGKTTDMNVYHPTTRLVNGRPDWMMDSSKRYFNVARRVKIECPCLSMVVSDGDDLDSAVPKDILEIKAAADERQLIIDKLGKQTIVIKNRSGERQLISVE
jgi:hypothetical protein